MFYPNEPSNKYYNFSLLGIFVSRYGTYYEYHQQTSPLPLGIKRAISRLTILKRWNARAALWTWQPFQMYQILCNVTIG